MLHLEELAKEYQRDNIRRAEQRRQIDEALNSSTPAQSDSSTTSHKLGHLLFVTGLKLIGWSEK
ncbi:MAG: hypothetical protein KDI79_20255 [Anaerolineae bacterium]|nr:hypothetical protein [Anaerolineae bacterium]